MNPSASSVRALLVSLGLLSGVTGCSGDDGSPATPDGGIVVGCGNAPLGSCDAGGDANATDAAQTPDAPGLGCGNGPIGSCDAGADAISDAALDALGLGCGNGPPGACEAGADAARD